MRFVLQRLLTYFILIWLLPMFCLSNTTVKSSTLPPLLSQKSVQAFIKRASQHYYLDPMWVTQTLKKANINSDVIPHITHPHESKPWYLYKVVFLTPEHIKNGVAFWHRYKHTLAAAEKKYGVPAKIIVAIIGVESNYGKNTGKYRVLDALTTLAFYYPQRTDFFQEELLDFLVLCKAEHIDPTSLYGSYAGAIGQAQFMPSAILRYGIDSNHQGHIDLMNNEKDVINSIAYYLSSFGWRPHHEINVKAKVHKKHMFPLPGTSAQEQFTLDELKHYGISPVTPLPQHTTVGFIKLHDKNSAEYWIGLHNLFVIKHYNTSILYAMAVYELGQKIEEAYLRQEKNNHNLYNLSHSKTISPKQDQAIKNKL